MKFIQIEKTKEYIFSHSDEDLHLIKVERVPSKKSIDGKTIEAYTSFRTKMLKKMTIEEIDSAVNDEHTVLIKIEED